MGAKSGVAQISRADYPGFMTIKMICVGGPYDGAQVIAEESWNVVNLPYVERKIPLPARSSTIELRNSGRTTYRTMQLFRGGLPVEKILAHESMTDSQAVNRYVKMRTAAFRPTETAQSPLPLP